MVRQVLEAVEGMQADLVRLTADLVALATPNPPGSGYERCAAFLEAELRAIGLAPTLLRVPGGGENPRFCVLATLGEAGPALHFHGHYDVVPPAAPGDFIPHVEGGRLYGRGSSDMKGGLAAMCGANGSLIVSLVPDEETGGELGTAFLWREGYLKTGALGMLMPEPTSGAVWNANRGAISMLVSVEGKPAHVGLMHEGVNAFAGVVSIGQALLALRERVEKRTTAEAVDPPEARRSVLLVGGQCGGGVNFNLVPEECWFTVDRRPNPEEDLAQAKAELLRTIEDATPSGLKVRCDVFQEGASAATPTDGALARTLAEVATVVTGSPPRFAMCPGLCEIRYFIGNGVPALAYGPGILGVSHGPGEYIEIEKIGEFAAIYALTALRVLAM